MNYETYTAEMPWGEQFAISADLAQASATIYLVSDDGERTPTQWQTADARHDATEAVMLALQSCGSEYYAQPGDEREDDVVLAEIRESLEVESSEENYAYTEFEDVQPEIGDCAASEYGAEVDRLDDCYTQACEGTPYTILARPARHSGEAQGFYADTPRGLQILGCTIPVPDEVEDIRLRAWNLFCAESSAQES